MTSKGHTSGGFLFGAIFLTGLVAFFGFLPNLASAALAASCSGVVSGTDVTWTVNASGSNNGYVYEWLGGESQESFTAPYCYGNSCAGETEAPSITLLGTNPVSVEEGATYVEAGATATDLYRMWVNVWKTNKPEAFPVVAACNVTMPLVTVASGTVNTSVPGTYTVEFAATDFAGHVASTTRTVTVTPTSTPDTTAPVITINGSSTIDVLINTSFIDPGATALDAVDGVVAVTATGTVDTATLGAYTIVYTASDVALNTATSSRTVNVVTSTSSWSDLVDLITLAEDTLASTTLVNVGEYATSSFDALQDAIDTANTVSSTSAETLIDSTIVDLQSALDLFNLYITLVDAGIDNNIYTCITDPSACAGLTFASFTDINNPFGRITFTDPIDLTDPVTIAFVENLPTYLTMTVGYIDFVATSSPVFASSSALVEMYQITATTTIADLTVRDNQGNLLATSTIISNFIYNSTTATVSFDALFVSNLTLENIVTPVDTVAPVISLIGSSTVSHLVDTVYTDLGATAFDVFDATSTVVVATGTVDVATLGSYIITYTTADLAGNGATTTRIVNVVSTTTLDIVPPVITLIGSTTIDHLVNTVFTDPGATAFDVVSGTTTVIATGTVDIATLGSYVITYTAVDLSGNGATSTRTVNVVSTTTADTVPPVITLNGSSTVDHIINTVYTDLGATAYDVVDATTTVTATGTVDVATLGTYFIYYSSSDLSGNTATTSRTVNVVSAPVIDTVPPMITLNGSSTIDHTINLPFTDPGATAFDLFDATSTVVSATGTVDINTLGSYIITYTTADLAGNVATTSRTVNIVPVVIGGDTIAPVITLNGSSTINHLVGFAYTDPGATALDAVDGARPVTATGTVDVDTVGVYVITYTAGDLSGNTATATRTVNILTVVPPGTDTDSPVLTILGANPYLHLINTTFTDPGATAYDAIDATTTVSVSGNVDETTLGGYTLIYTTADLSGNTTVALRVVYVVSTTTTDVVAPVITLNGSSTVTLLLNDVYTELGATAYDAVYGTTSVGILGIVDTSTLGVYTVFYTASDPVGNSATSTRTVAVVSTTTLDVVAPVITILGSNPINHLVDTVYTDQGAIAYDAVYGTTTVTTTGVVDVATLGSYILTYTSSDFLGNTATTSRLVNVVSTTTTDTVPPVITLNGSSTIDHIINTVFTDPGATAYDAVYGTTTVTTTGVVDVATLGAYILVYSTTDGAGNMATTSRQVNVVSTTTIDTVPPVITIVGANPYNHLINTTYADQGATAYDVVYGTTTVSTTGTVDITTLGSYLLTYTSADFLGNTATTSRLVNVVSTTTTDTVPPVITLNGSSTIDHIINTVFTDPGATAYDTVNGTTTVNITGTVDTATLGTYILTYTSSDLSGNGATTTRTVNIVNIGGGGPGADTVAPIITLNGSTTIDHLINTVYTDPGATALDAVDGVRPVTATGTVDIATLGSYVITYTAFDLSGNTATTSRTINIVATVSSTTDVTAPVITILGVNPASVTVNTSYTDSGATALDAVDGAVAVTTAGTVDTATIGTYTLTYTAFDLSGNTATSTRTVNVVAGSSSGSGSSGQSFSSGGGSGFPAVTPDKLILIPVPIITTTVGTVVPEIVNDLDLTGLDFINFVPSTNGGTEKETISIEVTPVPTGTALSRFWENIRNGFLLASTGDFPVDRKIIIILAALMLLFTIIGFKMYQGKEEKK